MQLRSLAIALAVSSLALVPSSASGAEGAPASLKQQQREGASGFANSKYRDFRDWKESYTRWGCNRDKREFSQTGCTMNVGVPYDRYDWTSDGCSQGWAYPDQATRFRTACEQHDFGYRNYGKGLRLSRNEATRKHIDGIFLREMRRICDDTFYKYTPPWAKCNVEAKAMWSAVHKLSNWSTG